MALLYHHLVCSDVLYLHGAVGFAKTEVFIKAGKTNLENAIIVQSHLLFMRRSLVYFFQYIASKGPVLKELLLVEHTIF